MFVDSITVTVTRRVVSCESFLFIQDYRNVDYVSILSYATVNIDSSLNVQQPSTLNDFFQVSCENL